MSGHADEYALFNDVLGRVQSERDALLAENQRQEETLVEFRAEIKSNTEAMRQATEKMRELRAENQRYEKALERIAGPPELWTSDEHSEIAREALAGDTE